MYTSDLLKYKSLGNGVILCDQGRLLFTVGKEAYWNRNKDLTITYTNTGGHVESGETIIESTHREVQEELDCDVQLQSVERTLLCDLEDPIFTSYVLDDEITPILIYNSQILKISVCVYLGKLVSIPTPHSEIPAIIHITPHLISGGLLLDLLNKNCILQEQVQNRIPRNALMIPFGSAKILAEFWEVFCEIPSFQKFIY